MYYERIEKYKNLVKRERLFSIFMLSAGIGVFTPLIILFIITNQIAFFMISLLPFGALLLEIYCVTGDNAIIKQLSSILNNNTITKTRNVELYRPKVFFVARSELHKNYFSTKYFAIRLTDENKNKYYYFLDELMVYNKENIQKIEEKFYARITVQCYENTNIIKTVENVPYFLRIKLGYHYS